MAETSRRGNAKGTAASGKKRAEVQDNPELLGSDEVRTAFVSGLTFGPKAVQYAVVDGPAIFEGDIDLGSVEDVTQADASSVVIAESVLDDLTADQAAVAEVEVGEVDPRADLVVRVHVADAGRQSRDVEVGDLVSTQSHPVLTHGHGDSVVVRPRVVGS
jgi:hypothetical protein